MKRIGKVAIILAVIAVLLPMVVVAALQVGPLRASVIDGILEDVNDEIEGSIEVGRVEGSLLGTAHLREIRVVDERGNLAASMDGASLRFRILPLLRQDIVVEEITAHDAVAVVRTYEDGVLNWELVAAPEPYPRLIEEPSRWSIRVDELRLSDGAVAYLDETVEVDAELEALARWRRELVEGFETAQTGAELRERMVEIYSRAQPLSGPRAPLALWIDEIELVATMQMLARDLRADMPQFSASVDADILPGPIAAILTDTGVSISDSTVSAQMGFLELDEWLHIETIRFDLVSPPPFEAGQVITAEEAQRRPAFELMSIELGRSTPGSALFDWTLPDDLKPAQSLHFESRLVLEPEKLAMQFTAFSAQAPDPIVAALNLENYDADQPDFDLAIRAEDFTLQDWMVIADVPDIRTSARLVAEGRGFDPEAMTARARLRLDHTTVDEVYEANLTYADVEITDGIVDLHRLGAFTPYLDLFASGRFDPEGHLRLDAHSTADAGRSGPAIDLETRADRADLALHLDAGFDGSTEPSLDALLDVDLSARWRFNDLVVGNLNLADARGTLSVEANRNETASATVFDGNFDADLRLSRLRFQSHRIGSMTFRDRGSLSIDVGAEDPLEGLLRLQNQAVFTGRNIVTDDLRVHRANIELRLLKTDPGTSRIDATFSTGLEGLHTPRFSSNQLQTQGRTHLALGSLGHPVHRLHADLEGTADGLQIDENRVARTAFDTTFSTILDEGDDPFSMVRHFEFDLASSHAEIEIGEGDGAIASARISAELAGKLDDPRGLVELDAEQLEFGDEQIDGLRVAATLLEELRRAEIDAVMRREGEIYRAGFHVDFEPRYQAFTLTDVEISTARTAWHSRRGAALVWTGQRLEARQFWLGEEDESQSIAVDGHFHPGVDQSLDTAVQIDVGQFLDGFYLQPFFPELEGQLRATARLGGTSTDPEFSTTVSLEDFHAARVGPFSLRVDASYADEELRIADSHFSAFDEDIFELRGLLPAAFDMEGRFEVFPDRYSELELLIHPQRLRDFHDPIPLLNDFGVDGIAGLEMTWSGRLEDPRLEVELDVEDFRFQGELGEEFFDIRDVAAHSRLHYHPARDGGEGLDFFFDMDWENEPAANIAARTPFPVEDWIVAVAQGRADEIQWDRDLLALPFELEIELPSLDLERLPVEVLRENDLAGQVRLDVDLSGTLEDPTGRLDVAFNGVGWRQFRDFDFEVRAELRDQQARIEAVELLSRGDRLLSAAGLVPLPIPAWLAGQPVDDLPIDFRVELHETPLSRLSPIDYQFARIRGTFGASMEITGSLRDPNFIAEAGIYDTLLGDGREGTLHLRMAGARERVQLEGGLLRMEQPLLHLSGDLPVRLDLIDLAAGADWRADGALQLDLESEPLELEEVMPLELVTDYVLDPEGLVELALHLRGNWEEPSITGFFQIEDGAVTLPEIARRFVDIQGRVDVDDQAFRIASFELHDGPSSVELAGTVEHELFIPDGVDIAMETDQFNLGGLGVDFPLFVTSEISAEGNLVGDPGELEVWITNLDVQMTDEWDRTLHSTALDPDIVILNRDKPRRTAEVLDEDRQEIDGLNLLVDVKIDRRERQDRDAWLRHPIGNIRFRADLDVDITGPVVAVSGGVDAMSGDLEFLGRRFSVQESTVTFTGSIPPNPRLQLEAFHILDRAITATLGPPSTGEPRIIIRIAGTAEEPRLELDSDPAMTETEILYVLMTGRPPDRTGVGRDEGVANQALAAVSGLFLGLLQDELAGSVPFDVLRLEPGAAGMRGGRIEVGRYLTNNFFVAYRRQFGADEQIPSNVVRLEYHFLPRWMIELLYTDRNEGELNLFWDVF